MFQADLCVVDSVIIAGVSEPTCDLVDLPSVIGATVQSLTNVSLTYSCDERHVYTGGQTTVTCTDEGEWPTPNINCEGEICNKSISAIFSVLKTINSLIEI